MCCIHNVVRTGGSDGSGGGVGGAMGGANATGASGGGSGHYDLDDFVDESVIEEKQDFGDLVRSKLASEHKRTSMVSGFEVREICLAFKSWDVFRPKFLFRNLERACPFLKSLIALCR